MKEATERQRLADEKAEAALKRAKNDVLGKLKGGHELDEEEQAFALEHNLYEVIILGQNAAKLLEEQRDIEETQKAIEEKQRAIELEQRRDQMIMERGQNKDGPEGNEGDEKQREEDAGDGKLPLKAVIPLGSNGRPKVHRKGRRMANEGRWVDRAPPATPAPETVQLVEAPTEVFDRKGKVSAVRVIQSIFLVALVGLQLYDDAFICLAFTSPLIRFFFCINVKALEKEQEIF